MTIEEFKTKLQSIAETEAIGLNLYFLLKTVNGPVLKRANLKEHVKSGLITAYKQSFLGIRDNHELSMVNLSEADDRQGAIYEYDLNERPAFFEFFNAIMSDNEENPLPVFQFDDDNLSSLEGYFISIGSFGNSAIIYRKQMPINLFKQGKIYLVKGHNTQFNEVDAINNEFLRIDTKIDVISLENIEFITNVSILERHYEFRAIIEHEAVASLENIGRLQILENINVLAERVSDVSFARKLSKISTTSPVFELPAATILRFVREHHVLGNEFNFNADGSKIVLDTQRSQNFFLRLMNDDFLHSQLTSYDYVTPAKDVL